MAALFSKALSRKRHGRPRQDWGRRRRSRIGRTFDVVLPSQADTLLFTGTSFFPVGFSLDGAAPRAAGSSPLGGRGRSLKPPRRQGPPSTGHRHAWWQVPSETLLPLSLLPPADPPPAEPDEENPSAGEEPGPLARACAAGGVASRVKHLASAREAPPRGRMAPHTGPCTVTSQPCPLRSRVYASQYLNLIWFLSSRGNRWALFELRLMHSLVSTWL